MKKLIIWTLLNVNMSVQKKDILTVERKAENGREIFSILENPISDLYSNIQ